MRRLLGRQHRKYLGYSNLCDFAPLVQGSGDRRQASAPRDRSSSGDHAKRVNALRKGLAAYSKNDDGRREAKIDCSIAASMTRASIHTSIAN
jgi:hypothetical protein